MQRHLMIHKVAVPMILFAWLALSHAAAQSPIIGWMRGGIEDGGLEAPPTYTPDGQYLLTWDGYPNIKIFSASTGLLLNTVIPFTGSTPQSVFIQSFSVCPSTATPMFAVSGYGSAGYAMRLYSIPGGELQSSRPDGASYLSFSPDCSAVAATSPTQGGTSAIYAINLETSPPVFTGAATVPMYIPIQGDAPQPLGGPLQYAAGGLTGYISDQYTDYTSQFNIGPTTFPWTAWTFYAGGGNTFGGGYFTGNGGVGDVFSLISGCAWPETGGACYPGPMSLASRT